LSDFIARAAARAVGRAAQARPRQASVFEGPVTVGAGFEVVDEVAAAPPAAPAPVTAAPVAPPAAGAMPPRPAAAGELPPADPRPPRPRRAEPPPAPEQAPTPAPEPPLAPADAPRVHLVVPAAVSPVRLAAAVPAAVPATVPPPAFPEPERAPVVRVHIGRLEVRASVQAAPPERSRTAEPPPARSLSDYLRGRGDR
jgi:hypothetical protein